MTKEPTKTIKISNFGVACVLLYDGVELLELEKDPNSLKRFFFIFALDDSVEPLINSYWNKELRVEPFRFLEVERYLKSRLHNEPE